MAAGVRLRGARALSWRLFLRRHSDLGLTRQPLGGDNERKMKSCIGSSFIKHRERQLSTEKRVNPIALDEKTYDKIADETLQELLAYFEDLVDSGECSDESDVQYESGVLTFHLGSDKGTYVINKQAPNKQIWLSSPLSGPKRYDLIDGRWTYSHDLVPMHEFLSKELSQTLNVHIDLTLLQYAVIPKKLIE